MSREKYENYLEILGLKTGASLKDIKSAYKKMVLKFHPDRQTDPIAKDLANEKLKKINEAKEYLLENFKYYGKTSTKNYSKSSSYNYSSNQEEKRKPKGTKVQKTKAEFKTEPFKKTEEDKTKKESFNYLSFFAILLVLAIITAAIPFDNTPNNTSNVQINKTENKPEPTPKSVVEHFEESNNEPIEEEVKPVKQKVLTEQERIALFEKEMSNAFDNYINNYGQYYDYPQLKDRTFTVEISSYLNNTLYRCKYINGDFTHEYDGSNLYRDFESFMLGLPIYFRDDAKTNYEMRYKMRVTHTPQGTTVKLLDIWHYLEGD